MSFQRSTLTHMWQGTIPHRCKRWKRLCVTSQGLNTSPLLRNPFLGGGFQYFLFSPLCMGKRFPILTCAYFSEGVEIQPPTKKKALKIILPRFCCSQFGVGCPDLKCLSGRGSPAKTWSTWWGGESMIRRPKMSWVGRKRSYDNWQPPQQK